MAVFGTICLWGLAILGTVTFIGICIAAVNSFKEGVEEGRTGRNARLDPQKPPVQITNLRSIPQPAPKVDPNQAQVLQKTTLQITTTKYADPNAVPPKELTA